MREIKFRAWIKKDNRMEGCIELSPFHIGDCDRYHWKHDEVELMQYTGLKDKYGKDVFEGDIIKCTKGCPHVVEWVQEYGGSFVGGMPAFYLSGLKDGYAWTGEEEIIGNIHENKELLEVVSND